MYTPRSKLRRTAPPLHARSAASLFGATDVIVGALALAAAIVVLNMTGAGAPPSEPPPVMRAAER